MPLDANALFSNGRDDYEIAVSTNMLWIILSVAIAGVIVKWAASAAERHTQSHLGFVSHQWLVDHRLSQVSDPQG